MWFPDEVQHLQALGELLRRWAVRSVARHGGSLPRPGAGSSAAVALQLPRGLRS